MHRKIILAFAGLALTISATTAANAAPKKPRSKAQPAAIVVAKSPLDERAHELDAVLKRQMPPEAYFAPAFLNAIPAAQVNGSIDEIIKQYGKPLKVVSVTPRGKTGADIQYAFERAVATIKIDIMAGAPNQVIGLLFAGFALPDDTTGKVSNEIKALPGRSGFIVAELDDGGNARLLASHNPGEQFAIGSTFKLYILAELANQVKSGERKWSDVTPLAHRSFTSPATNRWPKDSPATLHSLASWMIAVSDNSAADTLLHKLGREAVERRLASIGHSNPDKTLPFLSTVEAFALKGNPALRDRFLKSSESAQRDLIEKEAKSLTLDKIDNEQLSKGPASIDSIEWFASPNDLLWLLNHIRAQKNDEMLAIMSINPSLFDTAAARWRYVGYKGGSEMGVISMSYLLQSKTGKWFVVSGSWNDVAKPVDDSRFAVLMERLVSSVAVE
jgi:beta-lactamase class A